MFWQQNMDSCVLATEHLHLTVQCRTDRNSALHCLSAMILVKRYQCWGSHPQLYHILVNLKGSVTQTLATSPINNLVSPIALNWSFRKLYNIHGGSWPLPGGYRHMAQGRHGMLDHRHFPV